MNTNPVCLQRHNLILFEIEKVHMCVCTEINTSMHNRQEANLYVKNVHRVKMHIRKTSYSIENLISHRRNCICCILIKYIPSLIQQNSSQNTKHVSCGTAHSIPAKCIIYVLHMKVQT